jgi:hypothetical protein
MRGACFNTAIWAGGSRSKLIAAPGAMRNLNWSVLQDRASI